jgi:hypothetical protein
MTGEQGQPPKQQRQTYDLNHIEAIPEHVLFNCKFFIV